MGTVGVEVAVADDPRLPAALASLEQQRRRPERVLIVAATNTPEELLAEATRSAPSIPIEVVRYPGGVVAARAAANDRLREDVTAFLDSDEVAPPDWLDLLVRPIDAGTADFTGGPTRPSRPPAHPIERYYALLERSIYEGLVPSSPAYLPLQNSAWRTSELRRLGFDPRIPFAEDHDLESRALAAGLRGEYVPAAWVVHDKASETSYLRWARKRYRYLVAMAMSLMKNGSLRGRLKERRVRVRHPLTYVEAAMKPFALVQGSLRWRRLERSPTTAQPPSKSG
ncbi:MAG: glycosyltransferase family 2 protein [Thermoplasmata archaeon]|jgi:GT2 family glycosyltransferase